MGICLFFYSFLRRVRIIYTLGILRSNGWTAPFVIGMTVVTTMDKIEVAAAVAAPTRVQFGVNAVKVGTMIAAVVVALTGLIGLHKHVSAPQCAVFTKQ